MSNGTRPRLTGALLDIDTKLSPQGFKKIDSPKAWADLIEYLDRTNFTGADESPLRPNDHIWARVERDAEGTTHHALVIIPFTPNVTLDTQVVHIFGTITPEPGGDLEDATMTAGSSVFSVGDMLQFDDSFFASELEPMRTVQAPVREALPVRPGTVSTPSTLKDMALKGLRAVLRIAGRKP